ncbi:MAG: UDP-N-acetylmuramate--alanine ligase [Thermosediminibacterales bacterium]|nr:UDP-N-acetylmuramate--alanine ligase [Thermosediminibacterales bacterium]
MIGSYNTIHFIGIGGTGMSGIAKVLFEMGYRITGSDIKESEATKRLKEMGVRIDIGHSYGNVGDADLVVVSTAIPEDNPELTEARDRGIPIVHRADILSKLMDMKKGIAVTGAHGKTTTTSMISLILEKNNFYPTVIIGGELNDIGGNATSGKGDYLVAEADESDGSFLKLNPKIAVVTNIENDHLDYYKSMENLNNAFIRFLMKIPEDGFAVLGIDNSNVADVSNRVNIKKISFGIRNNADYMAENIKFNGLNSSFNVIYKGKDLGKMELSIPGLHNVYNALAAIAVSHQLGLNLKDIKRSLVTFRGVKRRFQIIGDFKGLKIIDDYAHHPTEIKATLEAAKQCTPKRLIAVFQPHRYTRTQNLYEDFGRAFSCADEVVITDIYSAGEKSIPGVSSELIINSLEKNHPLVTYINNKDDIPAYLIDKIRPGDYVITIGAGDIWTVAYSLANKLRGKTA